MKKIIYIFSSLIVLAAVLLFSYYYSINKKVDYNTTFEIKKEQSLKKSLENLAVADSLFFKIYLKTKNGGRNIKPGYYELNGTYSIKDIVDIMEKGITKTYKITIVEGYTIQNVVDILVQKKMINKDKFYQELKNKKFPYLTPKGNFEGYFYPATYNIPFNATESEIIDTFLDEFLKRFPPEKYKDKEEFYQKLIVASMLQREARYDKEKPIMASVIYNRLEKNMYLAIDSTVNFVFNYEKKRIYYKDLKVDSPYNTYKYKGLPPAPICNPTVISVESAYKPDKTDYLFFVAKGNGEHFFSKTYKEHLDFQKNNLNQNEETK